MVYFLFILYSRLKFLKKYYLTSFWLWLDITSLALNFVIVVLVFSEGSARHYRTTSAIAVVLMWLKFLYFFRILNSTAPLIRTLIEIIYDMRAFMIIFFLGIFGMAHGFYLIGKN